MKREATPVPKHQVLILNFKVHTLLDRNHGLVVSR